MSAAIERDFEFLKVEVDDGLAIVSFDRPPVNAVSQAMYEEIRACFGRFDELLPEAKTVIVRGEGRHFSAGNDLEEFAGLTRWNSPGRMRLVRDAFASIYDCPVPTIAAVHGAAAGTGMVLAAVCDVVVCGESAMLGTPEVGVGVMGGARHLRRLVPEQVMRRMYFSADLEPAAKLARYGSIEAVVPDADLMSTAAAIAARFTRHSTVALRHAKEALNGIESMELKSGYEFEQRLTARLVAFPDSAEARAATLAKREPRYEGQV